jgi:MFS superfamily sulfate permease-like transporter
MMGVIEFLKDWVHLIGDVFGKYPLAAALVTILGVGVFVLLERQRNTSHDTTISVIHAFITLIGWLISVPLLGVIFNTGSKAATLFISGVQFFYSRYEQQPIVVLVLLALSLLAYVIWEWRSRPRQPMFRGLIAMVAFFIAVALTVPIFNIFLPPASASSTPPPTTTAKH